MPIEFHGGTPWLDGVLGAAVRAGIADEASAIALRYRTHTGGFAGSLTAMPNRSLKAKPDQIRVRALDVGVEIVLDSVGVVVGFRRVEKDEEYASLTPVVRGLPRARTGTRGPIGPRDWDELIRMLKAGGYSIQQGKTHQSVRNPTGTRVYTLPTSSSDHRALANCTAELRKITGLPLRG